MKKQKQKPKKTILKLLPLLFIGLFFSFAQANATTYYVAANGNDSNAGTSPSAPWKTIDKARTFTGYQTGDDVYFRCGDTFVPSGSFNVSWQGTESNPAVIGAYYINGTDAVHEVSGRRPIISGSDYHVPKNRTYDSANSWQGLIGVYSKDYVHIKDLHILKSGFQGIRITGNLGNGTNSAHFLIKNVKVDGAYDAGIMISNNAYNYGIIEDCEVSLAAWGWKYGAESDWPVVIGVAQSPYSNTIIRKNYVHENWGEGIGIIRVTATTANQYSGHAIIEENVVWNNRRVDIYIGRTEGNIVRRNILLGAAPPVVNNFSSSTLDGRGWNQYGIWINSEQREASGPANTSNNSVYNNFIAGHVAGMGISSEFSEGFLENVFFYNNTLIGNRTNISIGSNLSNYTMKNVEFKNNISYCPADTICNDTETPRFWWNTKIIWSNNGWTTTPNIISKSSDVLVGNNFVKTTGWQNLTAPFEALGFKLLANSTAIDKGADLSALFENDYFNAIRPQGVAWDIGAHEYASESVCAPSWQCTNWSTCANSQQTRICTDSNNCGTTNDKPAESQFCVSALACNLNGDDKINILDYVVFAKNYKRGDEGCGLICDLNGDCKITIADFIAFLECFGENYKK